MFGMNTRNAEFHDSNLILGERQTENPSREKTKRNEISLIEKPD